MSDERVLYVLRHAKSSWGEVPVADHDRPLAEKGCRALPLLAYYVAKQKIQPDLILCSTAARTRDTLTGVYPMPVGSPWSYAHGQVQFSQALYGADEDQILERLQRLGDETRSVMIVGHNPGLQMLVLELTGSETPAREAGSEGLFELSHKLPPGGLVTLKFSGGWARLKFGSAVLSDYVRPKKLGCQ